MKPTATFGFSERRRLCKMLREIAEKTNDKFLEPKLTIHLLGIEEAEFLDKIPAKMDWAELLEILARMFLDGKILIEKFDVEKYLERLVKKYHPKADVEELLRSEKK